jgi:hypothetical protein
MPSAWASAAHSDKEAARRNRVMVNPQKVMAIGPPPPRKVRRGGAAHQLKRLVIG